MEEARLGDRGSRQDDDGASDDADRSAIPRFAGGGAATAIYLECAAGHTTELLGRPRYRRKGLTLSFAVPEQGGPLPAGPGVSTELHRPVDVDAFAPVPQPDIPQLDLQRDDPNSVLDE